MGASRSGRGRVTLLVGATHCAEVGSSLAVDNGVRLGGGQLATSDQTEPSDDDLDERFRPVRQWPEQVGSRAWRKRAAKELSSAEVEYYFPHVLRREELSEAERTSIFNAWQAFYAARDKQHQREAFLKGAIEVADALGGIIALFGVVGLVSWFFVPSMLRDPNYASWMYFHWAVALIWGISLVIRSPSLIRNWRARRAGDKIDFARMKQEVVDVNGHYLPGEIFSVDDYRRRYAQYKTDPDLKAAHAAAAWYPV